MNEPNDSEHCGLSGWALVNSRGELEHSSDADSNTSSIEIVSRDAESEEEGHVSSLSRESSPECIELEELREQSGAARSDGTQENFSSALVKDHNAVVAVSCDVPSSVQMEGACCAQLLQSTEAVQTSKSGENAWASQVSLDSDSAASSDSVVSPATSGSVLSISDVSSLSVTSRSNPAESDSESDFVRLEKESSCATTESDGEEPLSASRVNVMTASSSSVGSGFNFLQPTRDLSLSALPSLSQHSASLQPHPALPQDNFAQLPQDNPAQWPQDNLAELSQGNPAQLSQDNPAELPQDNTAQWPQYNLAELPQDNPAQLPQDNQAELPQDDPAQWPQDNVGELHQAYQQQQGEDRPLQEGRAERADNEEERADNEGEEEAVDDAEEERVDAVADENFMAEDEADLQHIQPAAAAAVLQNEEEEDEDEEHVDDADTESSTEDGGQDDRIESEQSDDANSALADDLDQGDLSVMNDLGDMSLVLGGVERHYIHCNNQHLNGRLNRVVLVVLVLALGMGLGHWIGSTREHFSQLEIQLCQMRRLHQMQDEYMQCLSRNDELLMEADQTLQVERDRHQEAMADLRDNNRELQEQLQNAQDQLEQLLMAAAEASKSSHRSISSQVQAVLAASSLLSGSEKQFQASVASWDGESRQQLMQSRQSLLATMEGKHAEQQQQLKNQLQQEVSKGRELNRALQETRHRLNSLEMENTELKVIVSKMRYSADGISGPSIPPPPRPLPPPPFAKKDERKDLLRDANGAKEGPFAESAEYDNDVSVNTGEEVDQFNGLAVNSEETDGDEGPGKAVIQEKEMTHPEPDIEDTGLAKSERCTNSPRPVPVDISLLQRNLTQERQRAEKWRRLYLSEREERRPEMNASSCLHLLTQRMNVTSLLHYMTQWNLTDSGLEDFTNLTYLLSSVAQLQHNLLHAMPSLWDDLASSLHDFTRHDQEDDPHSGIHQRKDTLSYQQKDTLSETGRNTPEEAGQSEGRQASAPRAPWTDRMKKLLNTTRGTLSNVSRHLQKTWDQVKDASSHLWSGDDSVISRMATQVKDSVRNLSDNVQNKASRWFKRRSKKQRRNERGQGHSAFKQETDEEEEETIGQQPTGKTIEKAKLNKTTKTHQPEHFQTREYNHKKKVMGKHEANPARDYHESGSDEKGKRGGGRKDHQYDAQDHKESGKGNRESNRKEHQFHMKAKHHSSHQEKAAAKAKHKIQKKFHKLFSKISEMNKERYNRIDKEDLSEMREDVEEAHQLYSDNSKMDPKGLPLSGLQWLYCQLLFWMRAERHRVNYDPQEGCLRYLAPWQLGFVQELRDRVQRGECIKTCMFSCIDGYPGDEEENYKFVCVGDSDYQKYKKKRDITTDNDNRKEGDDDADDDDNDSCSKTQVGQSQVSPKGQRENDAGMMKNVPTKPSNTQVSEEDSKAINCTAKGPEAWYFHWVQGRDNLRSADHKADWLFERASERGQSRHQKHSADWVFERAANRDTSRDEENHRENSRAEGNNHNGRHRERLSRHAHARHDRKRHHKGKEKFRHEKDYRQKYGRASFCPSC